MVLRLSTSLAILARTAAAGLAFALLCGAPSRAAEPQPEMTGDLRIHDPSVIEILGQFVAVGTGQQGPTHGAIRVKTSPDGVKWTDAGLIGQGPPAWAQAALGFTPLNVWAPSISRRGGTVFLYYCLSSFGHNASAIGLMTNAAFNPAKPGEGWRDRGLVLMSKDGDDSNADAVASPSDHPAIRFFRNKAPPSGKCRTKTSASGRVIKASSGVPASI